MIGYIIKYLENDEEKEVECSAQGLVSMISYMEKTGKKVIETRKALEFNKFISDTEITKIESLYNKKHTILSNKCFNGKIDKETFDSIIKDIKNIIKVCRTKNEFEEKYNEKYSKIEKD